MDRLKLWLIEQALTQKAFAQSIKVNPVSMTRYLNGTREPDIEMLKKIARRTGLSIDELVGYEPRKRAKESAVTASAG